VGGGRMSAWLCVGIEKARRRRGVERTAAAIGEGGRACSSRPSFDLRKGGAIVPALQNRMSRPLPRARNAAQKSCVVLG